MHQETVAQLLELNRRFYDSLADPFAESRTRPQPGFYRLLDELPRPCRDLLDVGCGDGRLGRFFQDHAAIEWYCGVDYSAELLVKAASATIGDFFQRDITRPGCLADLGVFDAVACLAVLQHVPGRTNRLQLLRDMKSAMAPNSRLFLSTWQFAEVPRLRRKIKDWGEVGLDATEVERNDHLMTWERGGYALRYVAYIDAEEALSLAKDAGLNVFEQFRSDGREGNLNLYTVLEVA